MGFESLYKSAKMNNDSQHMSKHVSICDKSISETVRFNTADHGSQSPRPGATNWTRQLLAQWYRMVQDATGWYRLMPSLLKRISRPCSAGRSGHPKRHRVSCSTAEEVHVPGSKQNDLRCLRLQKVRKIQADSDLKLQLRKLSLTEGLHLGLRKRGASELRPGVPKSETRHHRSVESC